MQLYNPSKYIQSESPIYPSPLQITPSRPNIYQWMLKLMAAFHSGAQVILTVYNTVFLHIEVGQSYN